MAEESTRLGGVVVGFNHQKGYGFIKPNNGGDNLFVDYSDVKTEGFFKNVRKSVSCGRGRDSYRQLVGIGDCYNCGQHGHMARDCRNVSWCYTCRKYGHNAKGCIKITFKVKEA
ncbi:hypothetical protein POM88_039033 [Heracleum sosnowskyi]|uniref:CCHC-type domain-containing protein n=1 Tax=Heracleum sosnowskyi TaxID=360622 RepID=A0AAD8H971_9APIA|nr:hypothetical protein POM88_039033 [Heracleum sosnowskyi]